MPMSTSHKQRSIQKIKAAGVLDRLLAFFNGEPDPKTGEPLKLTLAQVRVGMGLLGKTIPDLKAVEQTIKDERAKTKADIDAMLVSRGLDPDEVWAQIQTKH